MTQEFRLFFWIVVAAALVVSGAWAAWRLFFGKRSAAVALSQAAAADGAELLHLERAAGGRVRIRLKGHELESASEIGDPALREAVQTLLFALGAETESPVPGSAVPPLSPLPAQPETELRRPLVDRVRESLAKPQAYAPPAGPSKANPPAPAEAPWTFAGINEIVERLRRDAPGMPEIELSGEGAEIRVWFDGQAYRSVDDVPDERARTLIRDAVARWERE